MRVLEALDFRRWAARVARQAGNQPDAKEAQRLMSIAEYWVRPAEQRDSSEAPTSGDRIGVSRRRPEKSNIRECQRLDQRLNVSGIFLWA
jgi:hypothetical protein